MLFAMILLLMEKSTRKYWIEGRWSRLVCGVLGNEEQSIEVDYCRTLAASLFASDPSRVDIIEWKCWTLELERLIPPFISTMMSFPLTRPNQVYPA